MGLVPKNEIENAQTELSQAFRDLEEFDVTPRKLTGEEPDFYYKSPRNMSDYVAGQLLNLREEIPLTTDMERNRDADALNLQDNIADPEQIWSDNIQNMRIQVGSIDTAAKFLGFDDQQEEN